VKEFSLSRKARHKCPVEDCVLFCDWHVLMCRNHWFMVPVPVRNLIWKLWDNGRMQDGYHNARREAIDTVNAKLSVKVFGGDQV
jgi:hypothetical protein